MFENSGNSTSNITVEISSIIYPNQNSMVSLLSFRPTFVFISMIMTLPLPSVLLLVLQRNMRLIVSLTCMYQNLRVLGGMVLHCKLGNRFDLMYTWIVRLNRLILLHSPIWTTSATRCDIRGSFGISTRNDPSRTVILIKGLAPGIDASAFPICSGSSKLRTHFEIPVVAAGCNGATTCL
jgi:hypothetical protein